MVCPSYLPPVGFCFFNTYIHTVLTSSIRVFVAMIQLHLANEPDEKFITGTSTPSYISVFLPHPPMMFNHFHTFVSLLYQCIIIIYSPLSLLSGYTRNVAHCGHLYPSYLCIPPVAMVLQARPVYVFAHYFYSFISTFHCSFVNIYLIISM